MNHSTHTISAPGTTVTSGISATTRGATRTSVGSRDRLGVIRWLAAINMGLVGLQPVSAGLFLSGYGPGVALHAIGADALLLAALAQAIAAIVYWRRDRTLAWLARLSIGFVLIVFLQIALGYSKSFWLHVPLGVGLFGGATRLTIRLKSFEERE